MLHRHVHICTRVLKSGQQDEGQSAVRDESSDDVGSGAVSDNGFFDSFCILSIVGAFILPHQRGAP